MNLEGFVKRLKLPTQWEPPTNLTYDGLRATALNRHHLHDDVDGINASIDLIRRTRGGSWPAEPVTADGNYVDLVWHECEFRDGESFTYAIYDDNSKYLGCAYMYPMGRRTPLTEKLLDHDVDVSWWVTPGAHHRGNYATLHRALCHWIATAFPFTNPYYSNVEIPQSKE
jgi:hypothetical protein